MLSIMEVAAGRVRIKGLKLAIARKPKFCSQILFSCRGHLSPRVCSFFPRLTTVRREIHSPGEGRGHIMHHKRPPMGINTIARRPNQNIQTTIMAAFCAPTGVPAKPAQMIATKMKRLGTRITAGKSLDLNILLNIPIDVKSNWAKSFFTFLAIVSYLYPSYSSTTTVRPRCQG